MKRLSAFLICCILLLSLTGCRSLPDTTISGEPWDDAWIRVGTVLGVEQPPESFKLLDNKDALSVSNIYYVEWAWGEPEEYTGSDDQTVTVYGAQIYLLLQETKTQELAESVAEEWKQRTEKTYEITESSVKDYSGQEFAVYKCGVINEDNPYSFGLSAFAVWENGAVSVEIVCRDSFTENADEILTNFLNGLHYA